MKARKSIADQAVSRPEIAASINSRISWLSRDDVDAATRTIVDALAATIASGRQIEIRSFGTFSLRSRKARVARNPKTGKSITVPPKKSAYFKPSKQLRSRVDSKD